MRAVGESKFELRKQTGVFFLPASDQMYNMVLALIIIAIVIIQYAQKRHDNEIANKTTEIRRAEG